MNMISFLNGKKNVPVGIINGSKCEFHPEETEKLWKSSEELSDQQSFNHDFSCNQRLVYVRKIKNTSKPNSEKLGMTFETSEQRNRILIPVNNNLELESSVRNFERENYNCSCEHNVVTIENESSAENVNRNNLHQMGQNPGAGNILDQTSSIAQYTIQDFSSHFALFYCNSFLNLNPRLNAITMSMLGLTVLIVYLILGMVLFHSIEQKGEVRVTSENDFLLFDFIQEWLERTYNAEYANVTEFLAGALHQLRSNSSELEKFWESKLGKETIWTWPNALFYSFTIITTIGYGNIVPTTSLGKAVSILYGILGIPLFFSVVSYWGEIVHQILVKFEKNCLFWSKSFAKLISTQVRKAIIITTFLVVFYGLFVITAAFLIDIFRRDEMDFITSCYFCYITISSIGFGDYTLLTYDNSINTWISYIGFMAYVFLSAVGLAGVVIFRVYSCNDNYILLTEMS